MYAAGSCTKSYGGGVSMLNPMYVCFNYALQGNKFYARYTMGLHTTWDLIFSGYPQGDYHFCDTNLSIDGNTITLDY